MTAPMTSREALSFQKRVLNWLMECFSNEVCRDVTERNHRFLEEALELVQSTGCTASEAHQLVAYVFGRPAGEPLQEAGGVKVTFSALCSAIDIDEDVAGETELTRVWTKIDNIRAKQAGKPKHSPLPEHVPGAAQAPGRELLIWAADVAAKGAKQCSEGESEWHRGFRYAANNTALGIAADLRRVAATYPPVPSTDQREGGK